MTSAQDFDPIKFFTPGPFAFFPLWYLLRVQASSQKCLVHLPTCLSLSLRLSLSLSYNMLILVLAMCWDLLLTPMTFVFSGQEIQIVCLLCTHFYWWTKLCNSNNNNNKKCPKSWWLKTTKVYFFLGLHIHQRSVAVFIQGQSLFQDTVWRAASIRLGQPHSKGKR